MIYSVDPQSIEILFSIKEVINRRNIIHAGEMIEFYELGDKRIESIKMSIIPGSCCELYFTGKTQEDTKIINDSIVQDSNIKIENIWVNGILIERWALANFCKFYPEYDDSNKKYCEQNNIDLPEILQGHLEFFYNGRLVIDMEDFFTKYHACLMEPLKKVNHWVLISHLGHVEKSKKEELRKILNTL